MNCPQCQSQQIRRSPYSWLHWVRVFIRSPKYYCLSCEGKWKAYPRGRSKTGIFFPVAILISFFVLIFADKIASNISLSSRGEKTGLMELVKDPVLAGKLMKAQTDPSSLKNLTSSERQKLSGMKKALLNSSDSGAMGMLTSLLGDSSLAEKLMRSKGNPAALKNLSAGEKKKLKEIKDSMSESQIRDLKSKYGPK